MTTTLEIPATFALPADLVLQVLAEVVSADLELGRDSYGDASVSPAAVRLAEALPGDRVDEHLRAVDVEIEARVSELKAAKLRARGDRPAAWYETEARLIRELRTVEVHEHPDLRRLAAVEG